jgi:predicted RNA-binding protein
MASDSFKNLVTAFVIISLMIFLAIGFTGRMLNHYDLEDEIIQERLRYSNIEEVLNESEQTAENWREKFEKQNIFSLIAGIVVTGLFTITKQMFNFIITPFEVLSLVFVDVLGIPSIVFDVIIFLIIVGAIFGIWSVLKKGD